MAVVERTTVYPAPGSPGSLVALKPRYENFISGHWVAPVEGAYGPNPSPATGRPFCEVARSTAPDVDAAHAAREAVEVSPAGRSTRAADASARRLRV